LVEYGCDSLQGYSDFGFCENCKPNQLLKNGVCLTLCPEGLTYLNGICTGSDLVVPPAKCYLF
jgi:hypothetical protein